MHPRPRVWWEGFLAPAGVKWNGVSFAGGHTRGGIRDRLRTYGHWHLRKTMQEVVTKVEYRLFPYPARVKVLAFWESLAKCPVTEWLPPSELWALQRREKVMETVDQQQWEGAAADEMIKSCWHKERSGDGGGQSTPTHKPGLGQRWLLT